MHFAAYNGHLEMLRELLERFNCEADKRDKVNRVILYKDKLLSVQNFTSVMFLNTAAQVDSPVCSCMERPYRNCSVLGRGERL